MEQYRLIKPKSVKSRKRVGRGTSSGHGKTSCRGQKGQFSRSGAKRRAWFEGGQMPIQRRIPKRGFNNTFKEFFQVVNVSSLGKIDAPEINPEILKKHGLISQLDRKVKILGNGELKKSINVVADSFTASAIQKIQGAGGSFKVRGRDALKKTGKKVE